MDTMKRVPDRQIDGTHSDTDPIHNIIIISAYNLIK